MILQKENSIYLEKPRYTIIY